MEKESKEINDRLDKLKDQLTIINNAQGFNSTMTLIILIIVLVGILVGIVLH